MDDTAPGRVCPLHYRYQPSALAREPEVHADTLYVIGGLYGNIPALDAVQQLAQAESSAVTQIYNGDFNWFNKDTGGFRRINETVLAHHALRGNVETELAADDDTAGCGCGYPDSVSDAEVGRSNDILMQLRVAAKAIPELRERLAILPMHMVADVGGMRIAIVHGDCESLAGWQYDVSGRADNADRLRQHFSDSNARVIASSHTCLPVASTVAIPSGTCALLNNGAAGMPNFAGTRYGVLTRVATTPSPHVGTLYGTRIDEIYIDAVAIHYDHERWQREFLANWPVGSAGHLSYFSRIVHGPRHTPEAALFGDVRMHHDNRQMKNKARGH